MGRTREQHIQAFEEFTKLIKAGTPDRGYHEEGSSRSKCRNCKRYELAINNISEAATSIELRLAALTKERSR